jgi:hypothetical protein
MTVQREVSIYNRDLAGMPPSQLLEIQLQLRAVGTLKVRKLHEPDPSGGAPNKVAGAR